MRCGWPRRPSLRRVRSPVARLDELAGTLARDGLIRVDELLPPDLCSELAAHADSAIAAAQDSVREGTARPTDHFAEHLLHGPQCGMRHDCKLSLEPLVRRALSAVRAKLQPLLVACIKGE